MLALASPAMAHAELTGSNPAQGASLDAIPRHVQLTFSEPVSPQEITVDGPQGSRWTVGQIAVEGSVVTAPVQAGGPAGPYLISYRMLSEDNGVITGTVQFTMTSSATTLPPRSSVPAEEPEGSDSVPVWVWIIGSILVVVAAALTAAVLVIHRGRAQEATVDNPAEPT